MCDLLVLGQYRDVCTEILHVWWNSAKLLVQCPFAGTAKLHWPCPVVLRAAKLQTNLQLVTPSPCFVPQFPVFVASSF